MTANRIDTYYPPPVFMRVSAPDSDTESACQKAMIWLGTTPPSLNVIAGRGSRHVFARAKRQWQTDLGLLLLAESLPRLLDRVEASATLSFPTRRRRDEGNYRSLLEKALGDALVEGGWLADDTPDRFTFGALRFIEGQARTEIELHYWPLGAYAGEETPDR